MHPAIHPTVQPRGWLGWPLTEHANTCMCSALLSRALILTAPSLRSATTAPLAPRPCTQGKPSGCAGRVGGERAALRWAQPSPLLAARPPMLATHASCQVEHTTDIDRVWRKSLAMTRMVRRMDTRNPHKLVMDFAMTTSDSYDT